MSARSGLAAFLAAAALLGSVAVRPCEATVHNPIGKAMWLAYDGTDVTLLPAGSQKVRLWNNQAQASYDAFHSVESRRPELTTQFTGNGLHPVLEFDGQDDFLRVTMPDQDQPNTVFIVASRQTVTPGTASYILDGAAQGKRHAVFLGADSINQRMYAGTGGAYSSVAATAGTWDIYAAQFNGATSSLRLNGMEIASGDAGIHVAGYLNIGSKYTLGDANFDGYMAEFLFYNQALTTAEVQAVEQYLLDKYVAYPIVPSPRVNFEASRPGNLPADAWASTTETHVVDFNLTTTDGPTLVAFAPDPTVPRIGAAYAFDGDDLAQTLAGYRAPLGDPVFDSASFEVWLKPSDVLGQEIVLDIGGSSGTSITLDDDAIRFLTHHSTTTVNLTADGLLTGELIERFIQVVGVVDMDADQTLLYVNGVLVESANGTPTLWAGSDLCGLGGMGGNYVGGVGGLSALGGYAGLDGQIAIYRFYERALSGDEVWDNYWAVTMPEPATMVLLGCGLVALARSRRRRGPRRA
jgi:hypothetical protein